MIKRYVLAAMVALFGCGVLLNAANAAEPDTETETSLDAQDAYADDGC